MAAISHTAPTELEICFAVSVSINISPLTGLVSLKLIREGGRKERGSEGDIKSSFSLPSLCSPCLCGEIFHSAEGGEGAGERVKEYQK